VIHTTESTDASHEPACSGRTAVFEETLSDRQFATTLARGLEILRCFTPQDPLLGNKELSLKTGLPKPTISRFTYTLSRLGYLRTNPKLGKYQLGSAVLSLGYPLLATMPLRQWSRGAMNGLAESIHGSVSMGIRDRLNIVYVETSRCRVSNAPQFSDPGFSHPIAATSIGHAYLAACNPAERLAVLNEIKVKSPAQWDRYQEAIASSMESFSSRGFCISYDYMPEVYGVGVPLRRRVDGEIVVFNCVVSSSSVRRAWLEHKIGPSLVAMVKCLDFAISTPLASPS